MNKAEELEVKKETAESLATPFDSSKTGTSSHNSLNNNSMGMGSSNSSQVNSSSRLDQEGKSTMLHHNQANSSSTAKAIVPTSLNTVKTMVPTSLSTVKAATYALRCWSP